MRTLAVFFLLISLQLLQADFQNYFKKCPGKSDDHAMENIDFIYMINLDQRPEKWMFSTEQLRPYGIFPYRFSAVNGWELTLEEINDIGLKFYPGMQGGIQCTSYRLDGNFEPSHEIMQNYGQTYFCHCLARGAIGCSLSHLSVLQDAYESGYKTIWVVEDDIEVIDDPRRLSELIRKLDDLVGKDNWDILFTDRDIRDINGNPKPCYWAAKRPDFFPAVPNDYAARVDLGEFYKIGARWGAHSMILRRCGIEKLLQFFKAHKIFFPYDMDYIFPPGIKLYTVKQDVVSNFPKAPSDNGGPNYLQK
jgi:GR25 family glycosyltransferase involved in LPS biosynthesis